jgi:hypothetical protein
LYFTIVVVAALAVAHAPCSNMTTELSLDVTEPWMENIPKDPIPIIGGDSTIIAPWLAPDEPVSIRSMLGLCPETASVDGTEAVEFGVSSLPLPLLINARSGHEYRFASAFTLIQLCYTALSSSEA